MMKELQAIKENETWTLVSKPERKSVIGVKWIFKVKGHFNGKISKLKARLVGKGYSQQLGVDYCETFAPIARMDTIKLLIAIVAQKSFLIHHLDVKSTFFNSML